MAESSLPSSQDDLELLSSPPRAPSAGPAGKERRQPSITPRKFRRFFTPRARVSAHPSAARRALRDLTALALNSKQAASSSPLYSNRTSSPMPDDGLAITFPSPRAVKRRKTGHQTPDTSPLKPLATPLHYANSPEMLGRVSVSSMLMSPLASSPVQEADDVMSELDDIEGSECSEPELPLCRPLTRIAPLTQRGFNGHLIQRQLGTMPRAGHGLLPRPVADCRVETADFCSTPDDLHLCSSHETPGGRCIPFCAASCNTNGLVAIGDEEGRIRLLDSAADSEGFSNIHISFATHGNAVIDLAFSEDDTLLATASGDQTGKVIDMMTQAPISILDHHTASLKQVRFQPGRGDGSVLATSGRDGCVKIWDLRCKGGPAQEFTVERATRLRYSLPRKATQGCVVNSIYDAHARTARQSRQMMQAAAASDVAARWEVPGRVGEVSVTAIQFLPPGKEHLILSACEADASIKLWDIRNVHTSRHKFSTPVSVTAPPESHSQWRPFGISSMSLSMDGARLYALCKDNTVYAYSTGHLVLGHAPELSSKGDPPKRRNGTAQQGLGPLYGFRHENFHATSFYVKTAVRPARDGRSELLAVGSSDGCAILFPTDERYFTDANTHAFAEPNSRVTEEESVSTPVFSSLPSTQNASGNPLPTQRSLFGNSHRSNSVTRRPGLFRTSSMASIQGRLVDTIPIVRKGTALVRGHEKKEVGAVCWTSHGNLVSVGDDYLVRCWREDRDRATDLRIGGESEGRRWASGWADVGDDWDGEEDEWNED